PGIAWIACLCGLGRVRRAERSPPRIRKSVRTAGPTKAAVLLIPARPTGPRADDRGPRADDTGRSLPWPLVPDPLAMLSSVILRQLRGRPPRPNHPKIRIFCWTGADSGLGCALGSASGRPGRGEGRRAGYGPGRPLEGSRTWPADDRPARGVPPPCASA